MILDCEYRQFLELHESQLLLSSVPEHFWQMLYKKLKKQIFDAGESFALLQIDYGEEEIDLRTDPIWTVQVKCENGMKHEDVKHIYLIDHAWTYRYDEMREEVNGNPDLLKRLCKMMGIRETDDNKVNHVCKYIWKYAQTYSMIASGGSRIEQRLPIWYIMDELGCGIQHSNTPNFRTVPFLYLSEHMTYSLLFPIQDVQFEEQVTRDFVERELDVLNRKALLLPWFTTQFSTSITQDEPDESYFLFGHVEETLPPSPSESFRPVQVMDGEKIRVYSEYDLVSKYLTDPRFEIVQDEYTAHIMWYTRHFKSYLDLSRMPRKFVNQFPYENVLTIKDLLCIICRRKPNANWYLTTYNLKTELIKFVSYFQNRDVDHDNHWICKPWNLARSLDTYISNDLNMIVRLNDTGPKIVQKYVENPVLFDRADQCGRVKFDVRYILLLKSVQPLIAYVYKNFFLRFANKPFDLNDLDDFQKHFTVMNYTPENQRLLYHLPCAQFLTQWTEQYPAHPWIGIEAKILQMLRELLHAATSVAAPPKGIAPSPQSRAVYAVDIILSWDSPNTIEPKLLEINWTPDCKRACDYYPHFYNDIFSCLFLEDQEENEMFIHL